MIEDFIKNIEAEFEDLLLQLHIHINLVMQLLLVRLEPQQLLIILINQDML